MNDILQTLENSAESGKRWKYSEGEGIYKVSLHLKDLPLLQYKDDLQKIKSDQEQHRAILDFIYLKGKRQLNIKTEI